MTVEIDPSARMQIRSMGQLMVPAKCAVCGNGTCEEGYIDFGIFFDYEGNMYFCMTCMYEAATTAGCLTPDSIKLIEDQVNLHKDKTAQLETELAEANEYIRNVNVVLSSKFLPVPKQPVSGDDRTVVKVTKGSNTGPSTTSL